MLRLTQGIPSHQDCRPGKGRGPPAPGQVGRASLTLSSSPVLLACPLRAACSHWSCPLCNLASTEEPPFPVFHSSPVQWADAPQTEEMLKNGCSECLPTISLSCCIIILVTFGELLLPTGCILVGQAVRLTPTQPGHGHMS